MESRRVTVPCGPITLEGILEFPTDSVGPFPGAIVCHPHPLYGGNMDNNVAAAVAGELLRLGIASLRVNFRGVGASEGKHGEGIDELEDVRASMDFLERMSEIDADKLLIAGYSFGCWVGLKAASRDPRPKRLLGISPPLDMYDFDFLKSEARPKLLVSGDNDFVCSQSRFKAFAQEVSEPKRITTLRGSDHFHFGRETLLVNEVTQFFKSFPFDDQEGG
jgi:uncharacterized protein